MSMKESQLQQMLVTLRTRLLVMSAMVGLALDDACKAFKEGDVGRASAVIDGDSAINDMENEIDAMALSILARTQPVACDLRLVISALRMVLDLERIADECARMAEITVLLGDTNIDEPEVIQEISQLMKTARNIYTAAIDAFREGDAKKALRVRQHEDEAALLDVRIMHRLTHNNKIDAHISIHLMLISRTLNRVWRQSMNLAENTYFIYAGENLKHKRV